MSARALLPCLVLAAVMTLPAHAVALALSAVEGQARPDRTVRPRTAAQERRAEQVGRQRAENGLFGQGRRALDAGRWMEAAEVFERVAALNGTRRDAALYWRAYAQNRLGQRDEALQTLAELQTAFPASRYATQGRALEVEVRRDAGQPVEPGAQDDDQLRLIALQALQRSDPERALPMLEGVLRGTAAPRLKTRALFLVAQSERPEARQLLADVARGQASPELQERAIGYLVARGTPDTRALLSDIYAGSTDVNVKRQVVRALTRARDAESLVALARRETDPALKREMVEKLALMRNKVALDYLAELAR
jgi:tetratricopeptide (TPR) repeat protein